MQRRSFLAGIAGVAAAVALNAGNAWAKVKKPVKAPANSIAKTTAFKVGKPVAMIALYKGVQRRVIVYRSSATQFIVYNAACTHQGCLLKIVDTIEGSEFHCPCHSAQFDIKDGTNTVAPTDSEKVQPLRRYSAAVKNGYLVFTA
jgi:nitrite reductase/ring-hydroxylating ferredoxin subunit